MQPLTPLINFLEKMKFKAEIDIMPHSNLLDPQGKAVTSAMINLNLEMITNVRVGKHLTLEVEAASEDVARAKVDEACQRMLCNQIVETYTYDLSPLN